MSFDATKISDLVGSIDYLISSMLATGRYLSKDELLGGKSAWLSQTERFSSFFERIKDKEDVIEKFRSKITLPLYRRYHVNLNNKLINSEDVVQDSYIKIKLSNDKDFKLKTEPEGIYLNIDRFFLPVSEAYSRVITHECKNKDQNNLYATCILIGLYSVLFHSALPEEGKENMEGLVDNIKLLVSSLDVLEKPRQQHGGPMSMLQNFMENVDLGQIGELMNKVTGDDKASGEFGEMLTRMGKMVEGGGNPFDMMSELVREASVKAAEEDDESSAPGLTTEESSADAEPEPEPEPEDDMPALEPAVSEDVPSSEEK